jgi:tripartite-type tricarboxylate transporter receptor subunit TctC
MRERVRWVVALACLGLVLSACGSGAGSTEAAGSSEAAGATQAAGSSEAGAAAESAAPETPAEPAFAAGDSVTIIVPTAPGGGFDSEARLLQPHLEEALSEVAGVNVTVRVENAPGGDGRIGAQRVFDSGPDDNFVWYYFTNTLVGSELEDGERASYASEEFVPLALWGNGPSAFVLPKSLELPERSIEGLSQRSESQPLLIGGVGLDRELAIMSALLEEEGLPFNYEIVEGSGTSDTVSFLLRGDVEVGYTTGSGLRPFVEEEPELEFLVSTACEEDPAIPDVPTIVEAGWPNAEEICASQNVPRVFLGGPQMPQDKADVISEALVNVLEDEEFQAEATAAERYVQPGGPEEAAEAVQSKIELFQEYRDLLGV